jgi:hypothetical protein
MPIHILFWILMLAWIFMDWRASQPWAPATMPYHAGRLLLFVVIMVLLGWRTFGPIVSG